MRVELASGRKLRDRNKPAYRLAHWPIWIFVFFIAPGPSTFDLFERGFDQRKLVWLGLVILGTGMAALRGRLPGVEPRPYIIRFVEDKPNPLYRRICYTFAWSIVITFAVLNFAGLAVAVVTGAWRLKQIYAYGYFPLAIATLGARRHGAAAAREGVHQRRGPRAALFLRRGVGVLHRAAGAGNHVEGAATHAGGRRLEAGGVYGTSGVLRHSGPARAAAENPSHLPGELAISD